MNIAIILARAGSKRIRNKNVKFFFSKPIISYPIKSAINSKLFDRVIVSTESKKIAKISEYYGAEIPFLRPIKLADSRSSTIAVIKHAIKNLLININKNIKICCIYPATPMLNKKLLMYSLKKFNKQKADFSVTLLESRSRDKKKFYINKAGFLKKIRKNSKKNPSFSDAGQFYWGKSNSFMKYKSIFSGKVTPIPLKKNQAIDVNTHADWKKLKKIYKKFNA